ncbi:hypothetical protein BDV12DRAFT_179909 [Aspergillus spectabilis]
MSAGLGPRSVDGELGDRIKNKEIRQAIDPRVANDVERMVRESGQDLSTESLSHDGKYYPFRILEPKKMAESVVVEWFNNRSNIDRIAKCFKREVSHDPRSHLLQWFLICTTRMPRPGTMKGMSPDDKTTIIVWIALGDLGPENGLFYTMTSGHDMSLDGRESITFSGRPSGLAVLLLLSM